MRRPGRADPGAGLTFDTIANDEPLWKIERGIGA